MGQSFLPALLLVSLAGSSLLIRRGPQSIPALLAVSVLPKGRDVVPGFEITMSMSQVQVVYFGLFFSQCNSIPQTILSATALYNSKCKNDIIIRYTAFVLFTILLSDCPRHLLHGRANASDPGA